MTSSVHSTDRNDPAWRLRELIVAKMREQNMSQSELARKLGVTRSHVSQMLKPNNTLTLHTAENALNVLGYTLTITTTEIS